MKKPVLFSLLVLCLSLGACGKKDDAAVAVNPNAIISQPVNPIYPLPPGQTGLTLQQYCQYYSGTYNGTTCAFTQTYSLSNPGSYSLTFSFSFGSSAKYDTGLPIYAGERVSFVSSGVNLYLYNYYYGSYTSLGSGNSSFVAGASGELVASAASGFNTNPGIQSVTITTCMNAPMSPVACP